MDKTQEPTVGISVSFKANLGNYQSAEVSMWVSGLEKDATEEQIDEMLEVGKVAFDRIKERIRAKVKAIRQEVA